MPALDVRPERWPLKAPFRIAGYTFIDAELIVVTLDEDGLRGAGEAAGVYYRGETSDSMIRQIESIRAALEHGVERSELLTLLPPGGARNAVDCALWDLEAQRAGVPAWKRAGLSEPVPLRTTYTIGADTPVAMSRIARSYAPASHLKLKLTGDDDAARVRAVRDARPDAWIGVDANQAYTRKTLQELVPVLQELGVSLIEQPLRIGAERELSGIKWAIPLAADESVQCLSDLPLAAGLFDTVNIKLDKCGGLTAALEMATEIRRLGMQVMVGCMEGTSLSMAPALLVGQLCDLVDLDGAMFLAGDRAPPVAYDNGTVSYAGGWGVPTRSATEYSGGPA